MRYALTIKGKVRLRHSSQRLVKCDFAMQNAGYRNLIERIAKVKRLKGYVFNDYDGTVKLVCDGTKDKIGEFIDSINIHEEEIFVEDILKDELDTAYPIPEKFARIETDAIEDISRKLDRGVDLLKDIKDGQNKLVEGQNKLVEGQNNSISILRDNQKDQKTIVGLLEKISDKL